VSRYQAYPKYKASGVAWLGDVPEHWNVTKVKFETPFQVGWTPPTKDEANFDGDNKWLTIGDLKQRVVYESNNCISDEAVKKASMSITPKGSLLYSFKLSVGTVAFAGEDVYTNEAIASFLENEKTDLLYLYYATPLFLLQNASTNIYGAKILNQELIRDARLVLPNKDEQTTIANFLDSQTSKIDTLIAKQQRMIALLGEKRQALISHAVTKGLNPDAPMKDSGVAWLGDVPEHWDVKRLKQSLSIQNGKDYKEIQSDEGYPVYGSGGQFTWATDFLYEGEAVLLGRKGTIDRPLFVNEAFWTVDTMYYGIPKNSDVGKFIYYCATMMPFRLYSTDTALPSMTQTALNEHLISIPSSSEQTTIANFLDTQTAKIDTLISKAKSAITLLQERRSALISAVVTGKIDVRELA
jgi:type I restriction enzyme S subunit